MSSSSIIDWAGNKKIYNTLLPNPYPYPAQANGLDQVLLANPNAGDQNIENLFQIETLNVVQRDQIGGNLTIGGTPLTPGSGGDLRIQGATTKGSILVGNGTSTVELAVPIGPPNPDGSVLILDSSQSLGVRWGGESGPIATITPGNNIDIGGTSANPIVAFQSPTTSNILLGVGTEIQAKDNYGSPNFAMTLDATGFNDIYSAGGVVNQEDIAVSSTNVVQTLSATNTSDYINSATLTCDTNFISDTRSSQIITSGSEKTALVSISCDTSSSQPVASFSCGVSVPLPPADITASVGMGCSNTTNPNISISQSAPFAVSYSTIIDKDGINSNNSGGVAGFTINSNTQPLALTTSDNITGTANNIDLSTGKVSITTGNAGGALNPIMSLQNTNATGSVALEVYKNKPIAGIAGDPLFTQSVFGKDSLNNKQEYTRITHTIRNNTGGGEEGSIEMGCFIGGTYANMLQLNGVDTPNGEVNVLRPIDLATGSTGLIKTSGTGSVDLTLDASTSAGAGGIVLNTKNTTGSLSITGDKMTSITAGGNSGHHLVITLPDPTTGLPRVYKIKLENP